MSLPSQCFFYSLGTTKALQAHQLCQHRRCSLEWFNREQFSRLFQVSHEEPDDQSGHGEVVAVVEQ